jgi:hypothetical protein
MGYGFYFIDDGFPTYNRRPAGYMVLATCDKRGCDNEIYRGMGYVCGGEPHDMTSDLPGCGRYFCAEHLGWVGDRGGCTHRRRGKSWGTTLACMEVKTDEFGDVYCLNRIGHRCPHWDENGDLGEATA